MNCIHEKICIQCCGITECPNFERREDILLEGYKSLGQQLSRYYTALNATTASALVVYHLEKIINDYEKRLEGNR